MKMLARLMKLIAPLAPACLVAVLMLVVAQPMTADAASVVGAPVTGTITVTVAMPDGTALEAAKLAADGTCVVPTWWPKTAEDARVWLTKAEPAWNAGDQWLPLEAGEVFRPYGEKTAWATSRNPQLKTAARYPHWAASVAPKGRYVDGWFADAGDRVKLGRQSPPFALVDRGSGLLGGSGGMVFGLTVRCEDFLADTGYSAWMDSIGRSAVTLGGATASGAAPKAATTNKVTVNGTMGGANIRKGPGTTNDIVRWAENGEELVLTGKEEAGWLQTAEGWVLGTLTKPAAAQAAAPNPAGNTGASTGGGIWTQAVALAAYGLTAGDWTLAVCPGEANCWKATAVAAQGATFKNPCKVNWITGYRLVAGALMPSQTDPKTGYPPATESVAQVVDLRPIATVCQ